MQPRFRLFAGPNGSGKTFLFNHLRSQGYIHTEIYVSADRIENDLKLHRKFFFPSYRVKVSDEELKDFIRNSDLYQKVEDRSFIDKIFVRSGILTLQRGELHYLILPSLSYLRKLQQLGIKPICISCLPTTGN